MEPKVKQKIKAYTVFLAGFAFVALACVAVIAISGFRSGANTLDQINMNSEKTGYLASIQYSFMQTRTLSRDLVIYAENSEITAQTIEKISWSMNEINALLDIYTREIISAQEMEMFQSTAYLFSEYNRSLLQMMELGAAGDTEALEAQISESAPIAMQINANLQMMGDFSQEQRYVYADHFAYSVNTVAIILITLSISAFVIILVACIAIISVVMKAPSPTNDKQGAAGSFQNQYRTEYNQTDGYTRAELDKCVAELKAVAYDLSQYVKEIKR